jgi:hypothetical protein
MLKSIFKNSSRQIGFLSSLPSNQYIFRQLPICQRKKKNSFHESLRRNRDNKFFGIPTFWFFSSSPSSIPQISQAIEIENEEKRKPDLFSISARTRSVR